MSAATPAGVEIPPSTAPGDLLVSGMRRGALLVFLPVLVAGQALAWLTYAASRWYHPWSWFKIGLAETFTVGYLSSAFSDLIVFSFLIIFMLFRSTGIRGTPVLQKV